MSAAGISRSMRRLAGRVQRVFPDHIAHQHISDAADALDMGLHEGAQRHLNAAIASFAPGQLTRSGVQDDGHHVAGKMFMHEAHRHLLLVKDAMGNAQPDPLGPSDRAAEGPASPQRRGSKQFAGRASATELAREMGLR